MPTFDPTDRQGGKAFGKFMEQWEATFDATNKEFLEDDTYSEVEDLEEKLQEAKKKFIECDQDLSGDLNMMDVKYMMEKMGQAKTHLEIKRMIAEVDNTNSGAINYRDFLHMMFGKKNSILKIILMFESKAKEQEKPKGIPPKRDLASLP